MSSVPNNSTFNMQTVTQVLYGTGVLTGNLGKMFSDATGTFDPSYVGSKNSLLNFRDYNTQMPLVYDVNNNPYQPIQIGTQIWLNSEFICNNFSDGFGIALATSVTDLYNKSVSYIPAYYPLTYNAGGGTSDITVNFYNGAAIFSGYGLPITGWHIPSLAELNTLASYLGGANTAGGHMKTIGSIGGPTYTLWSTTLSGSDNSSGFNGNGFGMLNYNSLYQSELHEWFWLTDVGTGPSSNTWGQLDYNTNILSYMSVVQNTDSCVVRLIKN
jgi:uncharacterized protein (TIGR02145 family)